MRQKHSLLAARVIMAVLASSSLPALAAPGALDAGFGSGGATLADFSGGNDGGFAVALQADGKILVAGDTTGGSGDFAIARFLADGQLDPAFGTGGLVTTSVGLFDRAVGIAALPDGKIVVGGAGLLTEGGGNRDFALARFLSNGTPDTTFGTDGLTTVDIEGLGFNDHAYAMAVQSDGKVILAGEGAAPLGNPEGFTLVRIATTGGLDATFGDGGIVVTQVGDAGRSHSVRSLALQADGKIIAGGDATINDVKTFAVVRYLANGSIDTSFGEDGIVSANFAATCRGVVAQTDGKITFAGTTSQDFFVIRLLSNGNVDASLGTGGAIVTVNFGGIDTCNALAVDEGDKIILGGTTEQGSRKSIALARLTPAGALDSTFAGVGGVVTPVGTTEDAEANAVVIQPDGNIVVAGTFSFGNSFSDFLVLRYEGDPQAPRDLAGWRTFYFGSPDNAGDGADGFDFDLDGICNLLEFAFRLDPTRNSAGRLPQPTLEGDHLSFTFPDPGVEDITYGAEWSTSLLSASWTAIVDTPGPNGHLLSVPTAGRSKMLIRLTVHHVPSP